MTINPNEALSNYEIGIIHRSIGAPPDDEFMDTDETAEYWRGYTEPGLSGQNEARGGAIGRVKR